jgi:hypothetical protein
MYHIILTKSIVKYSVPILHYKRCRTLAFNFQNNFMKSKLLWDGGN